MVIKVEDDLGVAAPASHADDVIHLDLATCAHTQATVDAGVQVDRDSGVTVIGTRHFARLSIFRWEATGRHVHGARPFPEVGFVVVRHFLSGLVGHEQFKDELAVFLGTLGGRVHNHVRRWLANTTSRQGAFAVDFHHTRTAVTVGTVPRRIFIAKVGNFLA